MDQDDQIFITQSSHITGDFSSEHFKKRKNTYSYSTVNKREHMTNDGIGMLEECLEDSRSPILFSDQNVEKNESLKHQNPFTTPVSANVTSRLMKTLKKNFAEEKTMPLSGKFEDKKAIEMAKCMTDFMQDIDSQFNCDTFYGLPLLVKQLLEKQRGIKQLYEWQHKCLTLEAVTKRHNLIYCLPTSGGKTLVAEILLWREVVRMERDALLILPYVAIVQEKFRAMEEFSLKLNFFLEEYAGRKGHIPPTQHRKKHTLYIATIEKANLLINYFAETKNTDRLGLVVVDELHMIGESERGCVLEMILTKLRFSFGTTMIVGMSATIGNLQDLKLFLNAHDYCGDFRPVELSEHLKINQQIYEIKLNSKNEEDQLVFKRNFPVSTYYPSDASRKMDPDCVAGLVLETVPSASCLVFCKSKLNCENVAKLICRVACMNESIAAALLEHKRGEKMELLAELKRDGINYVCPTLKQTIPFGIAYHHAGLTADERLLIEEGFSEGTLICLAATSTLAAGVNLPAKRVIVREPRLANAFLSCSRLKQMVGRAGRAGLNECGESFLITQPNDVDIVKRILKSGSEPCFSYMVANSGKGIKMLVLNAISLEMATTRSQLQNLMSKTLLAVQAETLLENSLESQLDETIDQLVLTDFIIQRQHDLDDTKYEINTLGKATCKGGLDMSWAKKLEDDLQLHLQSLVLCNTWLHLLYLVIPYEQVDALGYFFNPKMFRNEYFKLEAEEMKVAEVIGITEGSAINIGMGKQSKLNSSTVHRFYLAMMLNQLWRLKPIWEVARYFEIPRGSLQNFLHSCCYFAQNVLQFCQELGHLVAFCDLLPAFIQRLYYCVEPELLQLMELPAVKRSRAQQLYKAGYKDVNSIANAQPEQLVKAISHLSYKVANSVINAAKNQVRRRFEELQEELEIIKSEVLDIS